MPPKETADLLIDARWVLPIAPVNTALGDHAVVVTDGRIVGVGPTERMHARFEPNEHVVRTNHALMPGFVNAHTRGAMTLLRGLPALTAAAAQRRCVTPDFVRDGTQVAIAEMLQAGITCFADMSPLPEESARAAASAHMHAAIGLPVSDGVSRWADGTNEHLAKAEQLWDSYRSDPWVRFYFAPPAAASISDATLTRLRRIADELEARIAMPVHESAAAVRDAMVHDNQRPLARLQSLGLLRPGFTALHMTQVDSVDLEIVTRTGLCVVACPQANLRSGAGSCAVPQLDSLGVTVGLGTASPARVGALDLLAEARTAALIGNLSAQTALHMATLGGANALGMGSDIGSLEPGKVADLVCFDLGTLACQPGQPPHEVLVFAATRGQASDVWTSGRPAVSAGRLLAFDEREISALARHWAERVRLETSP
jgi:5-methylthioadenosine/S-adenosylhomocysteine deaminase